MRGVTHPLLAALPWDLHPAGHRAVRAGEPDVHSTEGHAPYSAVQTRALVFTTALEGLSAAVHHPAEHASGTFSCCADPNATVAWGAVVTVKAFVGVANVSLCAKFAQLLGTHPAAPTGIRHQAHTGRTPGWYIRALALSTALLSHSPSTESQA